MRVLKFIPALFLVMFALGTSGTAWALFGSSPPAAAPAAPQFPIHDEDTFKASAKAFHQIPFNDPKLEFDIQLPKDWTPEALSQGKAADMGEKVLVDIARFKSPIMGVSQAVVSIQVLRLDYEMSADNWLKNYIFTNGYSLQDKVTMQEGKKASAGFITIAEGKSTYTYMSMQINGNLAVAARFEVPIALKDAMDFLIKKSIGSFRLILTTDDPVEKQKTFSLLDALKFTYPESWNVHNPDLKDPHNLSVQIHNETQRPEQPPKVDGLIRFVAVKRTNQTTLDKEIGNLKKYFDEYLGIEFKKLVSSDKAPVYNRFLFSRYEVYQTSSKKKGVEDQELRLVILGDKEWYIFMFLLTPTESVNLFNWARNTQTFDLIVKNVR